MRADRVGVIRSAGSTGFESGYSIGGMGTGPGAVPSPGPADQDEQSFFQLPEFGSQEREIEQTDEAPTSFVRTIIRGLGGFIWVIVLIAFTLARNCGGD